MDSQEKIEKARDIILEICEINTRVDWNGAEARDEFKGMYDLIELIFEELLEEPSDE
tara:strand:+ start:359 stop:529 length:171 start_codon:yes stop_codon:yes gene_type:complete